MEKFKVIPCDEHQMQSKFIHKAFWWVLSTVVIVIMALNGIVYSSISGRIDSKADKSVVEQMQREVHDLWMFQIGNK